LRKVIAKKLAHYGGTASGAWLVVHYGRAALYNTPFHGLAITTFEDVARVASKELAGKPVSFGTARKGYSAAAPSTLCLNRSIWRN
jgi:hypothetical protein